jgi:thiamine biosynthesis lipoprotein
MGTSWSARLVAPPGATADALRGEIEHLLLRLVEQMSHWKPRSTISRFNRSGLGEWHSIEPEFGHVLAAALRLAERTQGAFDPAMGGLANLWGFGPVGSRDAPPPPADVEQALAASGWRHIAFDTPLLRVRRQARAALDLSGIAKGYAVDALAGKVAEAGCRDFLVEVGGELSGHGIKPDGQPWWVELEPVPGARLEPIRVALHGLSVATSGDYRRSFTYGGRNYAHTLDPRTGAPLDNGVASVTVVHPDCMWADGWATALSVLGPDAAPATAAREGLAMHMAVREGRGWREIVSPALEAMFG